MDDILTLEQKNRVSEILKKNPESPFILIIMKV